MVDPKAMKASLFKSLTNRKMKIRMGAKFRKGDKKSEDKKKLGRENYFSNIFSTNMFVCPVL